MVNCVSVWTTLLKSRKKTFAALNNSASAVPRTAMSRKPSSAAAMPTGSGRQPRKMQEPVSSTMPGMTW